MEKQKLIEKRKALADEYKMLVETAKKEERNLTSEEIEKLDVMKSEISNLNEKVNAYEKEEELRNYLQHIPFEKKEEATDEKRSFLSYLRGETRALNTTDDAAVAPTYFSDEVVSEVKKKVKVYPFVKEYVVPSANITIPFFTSYSDAAFTDEVPSSDISADATGGFSKKELKPLPLRKRVDVSDLLVKTTKFDIEEHIKTEFVKMFGRVIENSVLNGDGSSDMLGMFVADADGITTGEDIETTTASTIHPDDFFKLVATMEGYANIEDLVIIMNPSIFQSISTKKADTAGSYLVKEWAATRNINGVKVLLSSFAPSTTADGDYVAVIGDISQYGIGRVSDIEIDREKNNRRGLWEYYGTLYINGMPLNPEAFRRLKVKAT